MEVGPVRPIWYRAGIADGGGQAGGSLPSDLEEAALMYRQGKAYRLAEISMYIYIYILRADIFRPCKFTLAAFQACGLDASLKLDFDPILTFIPRQAPQGLGLFYIPRSQGMMCESRTHDELLAFFLNR